MERRSKVTIPQVLKDAAPQFYQQSERLLRKSALPEAQERAKEYHRRVAVLTGRDLLTRFTI